MGIEWTDNLISWMGAFFLVTAFLTVAFRRFDNILACYQVQSVAMAFAVGAIGYSHGETHLMFLALATALVKGILIPTWVSGFCRRLRCHREERPLIGPAASLFITGGLLLFAHFVSRNALGAGSSLVDELTVTLALLLIGLFLMVARRHAVMQIMGILFMENAVTGAMVSLAAGLPLIVDLGIIFDVLIGVLVMGTLVLRIQNVFDTVDTDRLSTLHG